MTRSTTKVAEIEPCSLDDTIVVLAKPSFSPALNLLHCTSVVYFVKNESIIAFFLCIYGRKVIRSFWAKILCRLKKRRRILLQKIKTHSLGGGDYCNFECALVWVVTGHPAPVTPPVHLRSARHPFIGGDVSGFSFTPVRRYYCL